jgi:2-polyprenyl-3-methyl-5-hydroxy-6-metoxy-1,4-benzoquinol methylase
MKRKVYHTRKISAIKPEIAIWNTEFGDKTLEEGAYEVRNDEIYHILKKMYILKGNVLDAGCGYGRWIKAFHDEKFSVYGVDFAKMGITTIAKSMPNIPLAIGDVRELPFKNNVFDVILSLGVMEHSENGPIQAIRESFRCLKPTGKLIVSVPLLSINRLINPVIIARRIISSVNLFRYLFKKGEKLFFQYEFSINEFIMYLKQVGFKIHFWYPIWVKFGVEDDFKFLSKAIYPIIARFHCDSKGCNPEGAQYNSARDKFFRYFFSAFVIFIAEK